MNLGLVNTFLLIDDEMWQLEGLKNILLSIVPAAEIYLARDGERALDILSNKPMDMIFLDINMPVMDGIAFLEALRNTGNNTPVIIISAFSEFSYAQKAMRYGASDYLLKPYKPADIAEVVSKNISPTRDGQAQRINLLLAQLLSNELTGSAKDELLAWLNWSGGLVASIHSFESTDWLAKLTKELPNAYIFPYSQNLANYALISPDYIPLQNELIKYGESFSFGISECHLLNDIPEAWQQAQEALAKSMDFDFMENCLAYLEENLDLSLQEAADRFYFNASYFSSLIKRRTGMSYSQYIHHLRMKRAKTLLLDKKLLVQEVAIQTGYQDPRYFSRVFRQEYGVSPDQYRRQHTVRGLKNATEK